MNSNDSKTRFQATLLRPTKASASATWAFLLLPKDVSAKFPRRGRTTVQGTINGHQFQSTLEPDGQLSHWLQVSQELRLAAGADFGDTVVLDLGPVDAEPEPQVPPDLHNALLADTQAQNVWNDTTTLARVDWIHWIESAKQPKTRAKRIRDACDKLASGKKRVCCFDPSGFYSKALQAPEVQGLDGGAADGAT